MSALILHRTHPVDWNNPAHPLARKEPRQGERAVLRVTLATPGGGSLVVWNAHLEVWQNKSVSCLRIVQPRDQHPASQPIHMLPCQVFCGMLGRISQLADIFRDTRTMADAGYQHQARACCRCRCLGRRCPVIDGAACSHSTIACPLNCRHLFRVPPSAGHPWGPQHNGARHRAPVAQLLLRRPAVVQLALEVSADVAPPADSLTHCSQL